MHTWQPSWKVGFPCQQHKIRDGEGAYICICTHTLTYIYIRTRTWLAKTTSVSNSTEKNLITLFKTASNKENSSRVETTKKKPQQMGRSHPPDPQRAEEGGVPCKSSSILPLSRGEEGRRAKGGGESVKEKRPKKRNTPSIAAGEMKSSSTPTYTLFKRNGGDPPSNIHWEDFSSSCIQLQFTEETANWSPQPHS